MTARDGMSALLSSPSEPAKILVSGGIGAGKTTALGEIRAALRAAGVAVTAHIGSDDPKSAVVVDDAHLLGTPELQRLTALVGDPAATVVVATEPLVHHRALVSLTTALSREAPVVSLHPLVPAEIHRIASEALGSSAPAELVRALTASTAGLPFLLHAAVGAVRARDGGPAAEAIAELIAMATRAALIERLRRVEDAVLDTLLLSSLSQELGPDDVGAALRVEGEEAQRLVDVARASGLIAPSHSPAFNAALHRSLAQIVGAAHHRRVETTLLHTQIEKSTLSTELALRLAEHGLRDATLADALADLARRHHDHPAREARLYRAAAEVGASKLNPALADALALTGDCATAGRVAEDMLSSTLPGERAAAVRIAASVACHDGRAPQAAELFRWLGPYPDAVVGAAGVVAALGVGDAAAAREALAVDVSSPPTTTARSARGLAEGLLLTVDGADATAAARLAQSVSEHTSPVATPDTAAALVTLVALHGDSVRARSVIGRAVRSAGGDEGFAVHRHTLLLAWAQMLDGQLAPAGAAGAERGRSLHRRDALWAAALRTAVARRGGDGGATQKHWQTAVEVLIEYSVDLFALLPLGELWVAAARLRRIDRIQPALDEAFDLLARLGDPPLWSVPLHWAGVHAGILANSPESVAPHGQALTAAASRSPFARALAVAGRTWLRVLADQVDVAEVTAAARSLAQFGLTWDATRLAGQAALHTPDGRVSGAMLQLARDLKLTAWRGEDVVADPGVPEAAPRPSSTAPFTATSSRLSDREREVAELLLQGMPYRDIGSQLFISAKTVEHHVARIRRRLGADSRPELMSMLRAILESPG